MCAAGEVGAPNFAVGSLGALAHISDTDSGGKGKMLQVLVVAFHDKLDLLNSELEAMARDRTRSERTCQAN